MSLLDAQRLRPDIADFAKRAQKIQNRQGLRYLLLHPTLKVSFLKVKRRLERDNDRLISGGSIDLKNAKMYFPDQETRNYHARVCRAVLERVMRKSLEGFVAGQHVQIEEILAGEVAGEWIVPRNEKSRGVILHIHGGGFNLFSAATYRGLNTRLSFDSGTRIFSVNYRLAPEHKHPAAIEDCLRAFQWLIDQGHPPQTIILMGDSAGGNLVLALLHRLKRLGEALPVAAICISPFVDWTFRGKSWFANAPTDPIICDLPVAYLGRCYLDFSQVELTDPEVSPLYGNFRGFPPLLLLVSAAEMCLDDSLRIAEKAGAAGVEVQLEEWDDMIHVFPLFGLGEAWPEVDEAFAKMSAFIAEKLGSRVPPSETM